MTLEGMFTTLAAQNAFGSFMKATKATLQNEGDTSTSIEAVAESLSMFLAAATDATTEERERAVHLITTGMSNIWITPANKQSVQQEGNYEF